MKIAFAEPNLDPWTFPVYSGSIEVNVNSGPGSETLRAVYLGMVGDLKNKQGLDNTSSVLGFELPAIINGNNDYPQDQFTNYTYNGTDNPLVLFRFGLSPFPVMPRILTFFFLYVQDELWIVKFKD